MRKVNYALLTTIFSVLVVSAMIGASSGFATQSVHHYTDTTAEQFMPLYYNGVGDSGDLGVNFNLGSNWAILTGLDFNYCGNQTVGVGPYGIDIEMQALTSHLDYQVRDIPYVGFGSTGSWMNLNFTGPDYLISYNYNAILNGVNTSVDCPNILWNAEGFDTNCSIRLNGGAWLPTTGGEFLVNLRYQLPIIANLDVEYSGRINDTNFLDAYYFYANGNGNGIPSSLILNRTEGTGDLKMRLFYGADMTTTTPTPYDTTAGHLVEDLSTTTYPTTCNLTSFHDQVYLVLVESTTPGVDAANYTLEFEQYPCAPPIFAAQSSVVVANSVMLAWLPSAYADQYEIYRDTSAISDVTGLSAIYTTSGTSWTDTLPACDTYYYVMRGTNASGAGALSKNVNVTYTELPVLTIYSTNPTVLSSFSLNWTAVPEALSYKVYRSAMPIKSITGMVPVATPAGITCLDVVSGQGSYYYAVVAVTSTGDTPASGNAVGVFTATPVVTAPVYSVTNGYVPLSWSACAGTMYYKVYRSTTVITSVAGLTPIGTPASATFADLLTAEGMYYYAVVAVTSAGDTLISNSVSTTYTKPAGFPWLWVIIGIAAGAGGAIVTIFVLKSRRSGPARQMSVSSKPKHVQTASATPKSVETSTAALKPVPSVSAASVSAPPSAVSEMRLGGNEALMKPVEEKKEIKKPEVSKPKKEKVEKLPRKKLKEYKPPKAKKSSSKKNVKGFWGNLPTESKKK